MSVINRVLKDLDRQGGPGVPMASGVHSVERPEPARRPYLPGAALGLAALAAAWWFWPGPSTPPVPPSMPPAAPEPSLKLDPTLSPPPVAPAPTDAPRQLAAQPKIPAVNAGPPSVLPAEPVVATVPASDPGFRPRLDSRLPDWPVQSRPQVVKEVKPLTPAQQAEELWRQASRLVDQGRGRDAQPLLEQALNLDAAHLRARQALAVLALEQGQRPAALVLLQEGVKLHPGQFWFSRSLAQMYLQQGEYPQAAHVLRAGLGSQADAEDWALYAGTLAKLNRSEDTAAAYREALRRNPSQGAWWIGLGLALEQGGHADEAKDAFARALQTKLDAELREFATRKVQGQ